MTAVHDRSPNYLSSRSADVILSDVRPTKLKIDALRSINVLLDEILWLILSAARSFSTDRLKTALLKVLPTPLGKEALLEAEVELRAYWERTNPSNPSQPRAPSDENPQDFPLLPAFELMRLKCEAYSTLNDTDEDPDAEARWQAKIAQSLNYTPSKAALVAPAALYLTAILEAICEHVISNTGRVTARDSSRTAATLQDLYIGLCEDDTIYSLFKTLKVHGQIETQINAARPRRSKSFSRNESLSSSSRTIAASPEAAIDGSGQRSKSRLSSDSMGSAPVPSSTGQGAGPRSSFDKSKAKRIFRRTSGDRDGSLNGQGETSVNHKRSDSVMSDSNKRGWPSSDLGAKADPADLGGESLVQEFDDLMRSGATMKVSLTPDRLKTFELYNKEKSQRANRPPPTSTPPAIRSKPSYEPPSDTSVAGEAFLDTNRDRPKVSDPQTRKVDAIEESGEETPVALNNGDRPRYSSLTKVTPPVAYQQTPIPSSRPRSTSASRLVPQTENINGRKLSVGSAHAVSSEMPRPVGNHSSRPSQKQFDDYPVKTKRTAVINRESLDLDDVMNGTSDDEPAKKPAFQPKEARPTEAGTRDLISFLNDGPPELPPTITGQGSTDSKNKTGRFRNMVSRLTRGSSTERLVGQGSGDEGGGQLRKSPSGYMSPPAPPPLSAKKSLRNISAASQAARQIPISPPLSPSQTSADSANPPPSSFRQPAPPRTAATSPEKHDLEKESGDVFASGSVKQNLVNGKSKSSNINGISHDETAISHPVNGRIDARPTPKKRPVNSTTTDDGNVSQPSETSYDASKHDTQSISPPVTPVPHPFAGHMHNVRRLMSNATSADECRLLLDMFLAQSGLRIPADMLENSTPPPFTQLDEHHQLSLVEVLLSNGDISPVHNAPEPADADPPTPHSLNHAPSITA